MYGLFQVVEEATKAQIVAQKGQASITTAVLFASLRRCAILGRGITLSPYRPHPPRVRPHPFRAESWQLATGMASPAAQT